MDDTAALLSDIRAFLQSTGMSRSRFGRLNRDNRLVSDIEKGRSPSLRKAAQLRRFMAEYQADAPQGAGASK